MSSDQFDKNDSNPIISIVLSDLHLCEEQVINTKFPLWKKYKSRQFFFDEVFEKFLEKIKRDYKGSKVELILNGDIFDFDSVCELPEAPPYRISWLERLRGLHPQEDKSLFKIKKILNDHSVWIESLKSFLNEGHSIVFIMGNHDLELHFPEVQNFILSCLSSNENLKDKVRFCEWFYISNKDTLIEHGNQYDPYCLCQDPINPFVLRWNRLEVRIPFGNLATRYMINGMGFFNPHVDTNYIMSTKQYIMFFFKYVIRAQPLLLWTWFWGAFVTLIQSVFDKLIPSIVEPLNVEDRVEAIAKRANATPRMVRELKELFVVPAAANPFSIMRELWLDRAFLVFIAFALIFQLFIFIKAVYSISFFWTFIPMFIFIPVFMSYSRTVNSDVVKYKEPSESILSIASMITKCNRIIYGHTHVIRHEIIGSVEHMNSGTWSPAFLDVECEHPIDQKTFVIISPNDTGLREAKLFQYNGIDFLDAYSTKGKNRTSLSPSSKLLTES